MRSVFKFFGSRAATGRVRVVRQVSAIWDSCRALLYGGVSLGAVSVRSDSGVRGALSASALPRAAVVCGVAFALWAGAETVVFAAMGPWQDAVDALCEAFFGPIGVGLSLIAIVMGGVMFAFGEGGSKSQIAGMVFGAGLVLQAPNFLQWLGIAMGVLACGGDVA